MASLSLTPDELEALLATLNITLQDMDETRELMIADTTTLNNPQDLVDVLHRADCDTDIIKGIREKVIDGITSEGGAASCTSSPPRPVSANLSSYVRDRIQSLTHRRWRRDARVRRASD